MDDQTSYMLSGLLTREFKLGRIARFRDVGRGRQALTYAVLTAQQNEYLVYLYPPSYDVAQLAFSAAAVNRLDEARFTVMPFLKTADGRTVIAGPQNTRMLVGLNPIGAKRPAGEWSDHERSELGLRLAWLHKALREELPPLDEPSDYATHLRAAIEDAPAPAGSSAAEAADATVLEAVLQTVTGAAAGYAHGGLHPDAVLMNDDRQLQCFIDWGLLHAGIPAEDLFWIFIRWCHQDRRQMKPVLEAYASLEPMPPEALRAGVAAAAAQQVIQARHGRGSGQAIQELLPHTVQIAETLAGWQHW